MPMQLPTSRLILREFTLEDVTDVHAYASREDTVRYTDWGPNTAEQTREFMERKIARQREEPRLTWDLAAQSRETDRVIGTVSVSITRPSHREAEVGYVFHPEYWGRGYATEATVEMLRFGFGELKLHRIYATCDPKNRASARVLEKAGMRYEGHLRDHLIQRGAWRDSLLYAILETDELAR
jgi:[ribosomal protein S5]-alanine N-acetyltransferase